jgi:hypothetical protein
MFVPRIMGGQKVRYKEKIRLKNQAEAASRISFDNYLFQKSVMTLLFSNRLRLAWFLVLVIIRPRQAERLLVGLARSAR